jgi:lysophospholipase L1-like esterase
MNPALIKERMGEGLRRIKQAHPRTPLLFVENILRQNAHHVPPSLAGHYDQNETARRVWAQVASEFSDLRILAGENLLGTDDLATVDGVHPTDLGFMRMADALEPSLGAILAEPR